MRRMLVLGVLLLILILSCSTVFAARRFAIYDNANLGGKMEVYGSLQTTYNYHIEVTDTSIDGQSGATFTDDRDKGYKFSIVDDRVYEGVIESNNRVLHYNFITSDEAIQGTIKDDTNTYTYDLQFKGNKLTGKITPDKGAVKFFDITFEQKGLISGYIGDLLARHRVKLQYRDEQLRGRITGKRYSGGRPITVKVNLTIPEMTRPMFSMIVFNIIYQDLALDLADNKLTF